MRLQLRNITVDTFDKEGALRAVNKMLMSGNGGTVFTPNVDHVILAEENEEFANAYSRATIKLADGMPIVWASRLFGPKINERVAGSDFLFPLLQMAANNSYNVFWLGSQSETLERAHRIALEKFPGIRVTRMSPMVSSEVTDSEVEAIMKFVRRCEPDIIIVALGAPKQEIFIDKAHHYCPKAVMLGLGASLDFLAGDVKRAPKWMQAIGMEWFWRVCREPKRLGKRYLRDFKFPVLIAKQYFENRKAFQQMYR